MTNQLPQGFTRGAPNNEGCFVLITHDGGGTCRISVNDIFLDKRDRHLYVVDDPECMECSPIADSGIVAYMPLEGLSTVDLFCKPEVYGIHFFSPDNFGLSAEEAQCIFEECLRKYQQ